MALMLNNFNQPNQNWMRGDWSSFKDDPIDIGGGGDQFNVGGGDGSSGTGYGLNDRSNGVTPVDTTPPDFGNNGGQDNLPGSDTTGGNNLSPFDLANFLTGSGSENLGGLGNINTMGALLPAAISTALLQWRQSQQYPQMAERYAQQLDPFASQRAGYQTNLQDAINNPASVLSNPAYQAFKQQGLDSVGRAQAARGYMGSGNMLQSLQDYSNTQDLNYLNNRIQQLTPLTGAQFGPGAAAGILGMGLQGMMGSQNAALGSLFYPFGASNVNVSNGGGGGSSSGGNFLNTIAGLAGRVLGFSDARLKTDVKRVGLLESGLPVYSYTKFGHKELGVMAQDVEQIMPDAVHTHPSGYKMVDYNKVL